MATWVNPQLRNQSLKLASVATNTLGASGRAMLEAMIKGEQDSQGLAEMSQRKLRNKIPELQQAMAGRVTSHHRFLLEEFLDDFRFVESEMGGSSSRRSRSAWALSRVRSRGSAPFREPVAASLFVPGGLGCFYEERFQKTLPRLPR
jgi:hypothetical protein